MSRTKTRVEKFPLTVRRGSSVVKIYRETKASGSYYRVSFYKGGRRCGLNFANLEEAKREAEAKAAQLSRGDLDALQISGSDRLVYGRALEAIRTLGMPLDAAALEFAEAKKTLEGFSLQEAARFYMRHHGRGIHPKPVSDAVTEMIAAKKAKGLSTTYLADLRYRLGALAEAFHCNVNAIVPDDLRLYLDALSLDPRGFNNSIATIRTFFNFAQDRGWLSKESDLLSGIEKRKERTAPIEIFTSSEMTELLRHASNEARAAVALAAFAGLRAEEILRLTWTDVERRPGFIEVAADKAKTAARRLVPISKNLHQWLAVSKRETEDDSKNPKSSDLVWPHSKAWFFESQRDTVKRINSKKKKKDPSFKWKPNGLRHSFISYRLAEIQDVNQVALEAGNSPRMIFQHYRELCTPAEAKTWFSLSPEEPSNVLSITQVS